MVFASFIFLFWFLPLFLPAYFAAPVRLRNLLLTLASFVFYGWWRPQYVLLMVFTITLDWAVALGMREPGAHKHRRLLLIFSLWQAHWSAGENLHDHIQQLGLLDRFGEKSGKLDRLST